MDVTILQGGVDGGIIAQQGTRQTDFLRRLLAIALDARRDDDVFREADRFEILERNRIGETPVEIKFAADFDRAGDERHRRRRAQPGVRFRRDAIELFVDGLPGFDIRAADMEFHRIAREGVLVEGIELLGQFAIAEIGVEEIARRQETPDAAIARIVRVLLVVADCAAGLTALVVAPEARAGRDADKAIEEDAVFHPDVQNARGEKSAHAAALEDESRLLHT